MDATSSSDDWSSFHVLEESPTAIDCVGLMWFLPNGQLPIEVAFDVEGATIRHQVWLAHQDARWRSLSESKRWKALYLYATEGTAAPWSWSDPVVGTVDLA